MVVAAIPFSTERHTADNIAANVKRIMKDSNLDMRRIVCIVRDNASNMLKASNDLQIPS